MCAAIELEPGAKYSVIIARLPSYRRTDDDTSDALGVNAAPPTQKIKQGLCENSLRRSVRPLGGRNFAIFSALLAYAKFGQRLVVASAKRHLKGEEGFGGRRADGKHAAVCAGDLIGDIEAQP